MTSTTAAAATLAEGEYLAHRPRGVVHLYRGPLTKSGRYAQRGPACGTRTNRLQLLEPPAGGPLDPAWTRRLCKRCEPLLTVATAPVTREDWDAWSDLRPQDLAVDLRMAETVEEVDRVAFLALRVLGKDAASAPLPGRDSAASLLARIGMRRTQVDVEAAERRRAQDQRSREIVARQQAADARERAADAERLAHRTGNAVDRLRAERSRLFADAETDRARQMTGAA